MAAEYLKLTLIDSEHILDHWWQWLLLGISVGSLLVGSLYLAWEGFKRLRKYWEARRRRNRAALPPPVARYFSQYGTASPLALQRTPRPKPKSFGVYLGPLASTVTADEARVLSQWDLVVLDPRQPGVLDTVATSPCSADHVVARLDLAALLPELKPTDGPAAVLRGLDKVTTTAFEWQKRSQGLGSGFTSVLVAGWDTAFTVSVCNEVLDFLAGLGFDVYLELADPNFLGDDRTLRLDLLSGMVIRNGSILPGGERRDYFGMAQMRTTIQAMVGQACLRQFSTMVWDTVDDDVPLSYAIIRRTHSWCSFYGALLWAGRKSTLYDAATNVVPPRPLGAFDWLKDEAVMKLHDNWRFNPRVFVDRSRASSVQETIESLLPGAAATLAVGHFQPGTHAPTVSTQMDQLDFAGERGRVRRDPLSCSPDDVDHTSLGCFPVGFHSTLDDFNAVVRTQCRLKDLKLLETLTSAEMVEVGKKIRALRREAASNALLNNPSVLEAVDELTSLLLSNRGSGGSGSSGRSRGRGLNIHRGLDSGFGSTPETQFWAVYEFDPLDGGLDIFVSNKAQDLPGTILHAFMSSRSCTRPQCFEAELELARSTGVAAAALTKGDGLPARVVQDLEMLSPGELLRFMRHVASSHAPENPAFIGRLRAFCDNRLLDMPSLERLRRQNTVIFLRGEVSVEQLIRDRLAWYARCGSGGPDLEAALSFFHEVDALFRNALEHNRAGLLDKVTATLESLLRPGQVTAQADLVALAFFCAARKAAAEEIYLDVTDRNPLWNDQADQAAAFAELFALGSRCESYFDMTPSAFGKILTDRYRARYDRQQPPDFDDCATVLATTYSAAQLDIDPDAKPPSMPAWQRLTFLSVFAIPALIDILLLTTTGRGLYLSAFMGNTEQKMATYALMAALPLSGAVGTWIGCLGSYYMFSMAFAAMSMAIFTRFIAGLAFVLVGAALAVIIITPLMSFYAAAIFFLYFIALTTYLFLLAILANLQFPGYSFQSGKTIVVGSLPVLLIAPTITFWVRGHDIIVYLIVLYLFVGLLFFGSRRIASRWCNWFFDVPRLTDGEVLQWYMTNKAGGNKDCFDGMTDPAALQLARETLFGELQKELERPFWKKSKADQLIRKLAKGFPATKFLLDWYCRHSNTKLPYPFSSTWNIQVKVAIETLQSAQKGIRLHNGFIHWRRYAPEVGCGVLYFVIALLDKWIELLSGGRLVGLSAASDKTARIPTGFGLAFYLVGAVILDIKAMALYELSNQIMPVRIRSVAALREAAINDAKKKRRLYWSTLGRILLIHVWGLAMASGFVWAFDGSMEGMSVFLCYVVAYSGLLWYQYNKVFAGPRALKPLFASVLVGLPVGFILRHFFPAFALAPVIALGTGTWMAALLTLRSANIGMPTFKDGSTVTDAAVYHSHGTLGENFPASQRELSEIFDTVCDLPSDGCYNIGPQVRPGDEITAILASSKQRARSANVAKAFPEASWMLNRTLELWNGREIRVSLVSVDYLMQSSHRARAISKLFNRQLHVVVGVYGEFDATTWSTMDMHRNCFVVAEALVHAVCEMHLGFSHGHSVLAESLVADNAMEDLETSLPHGIRRLIESYAMDERAALVRAQGSEILRHLCLGIDCDKEWEGLPDEARSLLTQRTVGVRSDLTRAQMSWLMSRHDRAENVDAGTYLSRCDLGAAFAGAIGTYAADPSTAYIPQGSRILPANSKLAQSNNVAVALKPPRRGISGIVLPRLARISRALGGSVKFLVIALIADPEFQREFNYVLFSKPAVVRYPLTFVFNGIWLYARFLQDIALPFFILYGRPKISRVAKDIEGLQTTIGRKRVTIESMEGPSTGFVERGDNGDFKLYLYSGRHDRRPESNDKLFAINSYSRKMDLLRRQEYKSQSLVNEFEYDYVEAKRPSSIGAWLFKRKGCRFPLGRRCVLGQLGGQNVEYDEQGLVSCGSVLKGQNLSDFRFQYRRGARFDDELLRAEYDFGHLIARVSWCAPPKRRRDKLDRWIPHAKVTDATFREGENEYKCKWSYDHKFHPVITTRLNGQDVCTPPMVVHDWLDVLKKPRKCSFADENPLLYFRSVSISWFSRLLALNTRRFEVSTSQARTHLWKTWKLSKDLDGVMVRWLDERALRANNVMKSYWAARDRGSFTVAEQNLSANADAIMASVDLDSDTSSWTPLAFKMADFFYFGLGGEAVINTRSIANQLQADGNTLHVLATDTGTWPNEGGGVSACRRDLVNNLQSIRWHMVVESANDFGVPKYQIEENVQSLKVLPLWGLDFLTPTHGVFQNSLDSAVHDRFRTTTDYDIERKFIPILDTLVKGARSTGLNSASVQHFTKAFVDLNSYFETSRVWTAVWSSELVKNRWRELWLTEDMENAKPASQWFNTEHPTLTHLDQGLELWYRYLFIFSLPVPEEIPTVFQASHHSVSASYGVVCKVKRNCTLQVWDHAISWRETNLYLSSALCFLSPFVRNCLIGLLRMTSVLVLSHADTILPCADFFNPGWEIEIGTAEGALQHRRSFARKVDPVVNGICNMERFKPIPNVKSEKPTVTMLSHVWYAKDIKTALLAADIIVNEWGFRDYRLDIYGALDKAPTYATECQEIVASKGLREQVALKGTADPTKVLEETWVFMNSSISEGLPLALGEAALTGAPIVCTDVGASLRVLTDPDDGKRYSAVVAPNDVRSLARAQIQILGMIGEWAQYAGDSGPAPVLPASPTPEDVQAITRRMYEKKSHLRNLGMMAREIVQKSFSGDRYLREHEQMLWIGQQRSRSYVSPSRGIGDGSFPEPDYANDNLPDAVDEKAGSGSGFLARKASKLTGFLSIKKSSRKARNEKRFTETLDIDNSISSGATPLFTWRTGSIASPRASHFFDGTQSPSAPYSPSAPHSPPAPHSPSAPSHYRAMSVASRTSSPWGRPASQTSSPRASPRVSTPWASPIPKFPEGLLDPERGEKFQL